MGEDLYEFVPLEPRTPRIHAFKLGAGWSMCGRVAWSYGGDRDGRGNCRTCERLVGAALAPQGGGEDG